MSRHGYLHRQTGLRRTPHAIHDATIVWTTTVTDPATGGPTLRGKLSHHDRSRYTPHQGAKETAKNAKNLAK